MPAQEAYTASELAELLGVTVMTVHRRATREGWQSRPRKGRGGGKEFLLASMPAATREAISNALMASAPAIDAPAIPEAAPAPAVQATPTASLTAHQRETALARLAFVREIERAAAMIGKEKAIRNLLTAASDGSLAPRLSALIRVANDRYGDGSKRGLGLSRRRLYDWCAKFAEGGEAALAPRHQGKDMRVPEWAPAFLALYRQPQKRTLPDVYKEFAEAWPGKAPSLFAVRRFLDKMALPERERGRKTGNALLKLCPYKQRKTDELWPTDIYTADGTTFDAEVQHPLYGYAWKPEVTLVIDVATRRCVGMAIGEAENAFTVLDALRVACLYGGIPAILYVDNGPGYQNAIMADERVGMLARLDIEMRNSIPSRPQGKGLMERAVQTICVSASKRLASCTHDDMDQDAGKKVFKIGRAQLKKLGKSALLPTFEEFKQVLLKRVDEYNSSPHRSLPKIADEATGKRRHMSPDEYWKSFGPRGFAPLMVPPALNAELFMPGVPRQVRNGIVQIFSSNYYSDDLADFHGDYVEVRYDIWDSSKVYCWTTNGEMICTAELDGNAMDYFPMSQIEAARERRAKGKVSRLVEKLERVAPGSTVQLPEPAPTYTMMADSIVKAEPLTAKPLPVDCIPTEKAPVQAAPEVGTAAKRPVFTSMEGRYTWLMQNTDKWTDKDNDWLLQYVNGTEYAGMHTYYEVRCIAWPGYVQKSSTNKGE